MAASAHAESKIVWALLVVQPGTRPRSLKATNSRSLRLSRDLSQAHQEEVGRGVMVNTQQAVQGKQRVMLEKIAGLQAQALGSLQS